MPSPPIEAGNGDRLVTTLFFAALVHGIVILGVGFSPEDRAPGTPSQRMEVTLATGKAMSPPEQADYYAQLDQRGEGNTTERVPPRSALSTPSVLDHPGLRDAWSPLPTMPAERTSPDPNSLRAEASEITRQLITSDAGRTKVTSDARAAAAPTERLRVTRMLQSKLEDTQPTDATTVEPQATADEPREKFVSVNTRSHVYAPYLHRWRGKVERVGSLNFPDEIRRQGLYGSVTVEVALGADGQLEDVAILDPSRHRKLDEAVLRILHLAAPFAPFTDTMRQETDVIRFTYEWRFLPGGNGQPTGRVLTGS